MLIIDYSKIRDNIINISKNNKLGLTLKNDAYGIGIKRIVSIVDDLVEFYAVIDLCEAVKLRALTKKNILLLEYSSNLDIIKKYNIIPTAKSYIEISEYETNEIKYEIIFDVGMNRFGFRQSDESLLNGKFLSGIYAHVPYYSLFINDKLEKLSLLAKEKNLFYHVGGSELVGKTSSNLRIGFKIYKDSIKLYGRVVDVRVIDKGEKIGYGGAYSAKSSHLFAILDVGYKNGISTEYKGYVVKGNKKYNVIGRICMNNTFIEADSNIKVGDYVEFIGDSISLSKFALSCKKSEYETFLSIT